MNLIRVIDNRPLLFSYCTIQVKSDKAADNIVKCLIENGMMVERKTVEERND